MEAHQHNTQRQMPRDSAVLALIAGRRPQFWGELNDYQSCVSTAKAEAAGGRRRRRRRGSRAASLFTVASPALLCLPYTTNETRC